MRRFDLFPVVLIIAILAFGIFMIGNSIVNPTVTSGKLTCHSQGVVIFDQRVESAYTDSGGAWNVNGEEIVITGDCVFVEDK